MSDIMLTRGIFLGALGRLPRDAEWEHETERTASDGVESACMRFAGCPEFEANMAEVNWDAYDGAWDNDADDDWDTQGEWGEDDDW